MARRASFLAPTAASLPDTLRVPSSASPLIKSLAKLSRSSLISLVLIWLEDRHLPTCRPFLLADESQSRDQDDGTNIYTAAESVEELRRIYEGFRHRKGGKREIIDRILEGDWRHGLTLRQLAMADVQYIEEHTTSHRWTVLRIDPTRAASKTDDGTAQDYYDDSTTALPPFQTSTFLGAMQREISPLVKAHYHVHRFRSLPLTLVRILVIDSPYQLPRQTAYTFTDASRLIYLAFPDSTPFIYSSLISIPSSKKDEPINTYTTDVRTLRRIVYEALPKALSRPQRRYTLSTTSLTAKSIHTLLTLRGPWRTNAANGAFTVFSDAVAETGPLEPRLNSDVPCTDVTAKSVINEESSRDKENQSQAPSNQMKRPRLGSALETESLKQRKKVLLSRFGTSGDPNRPPHPSSIPKTPDTSESVNSSTPQPATNRPLSEIAPNPALDRLQIHLQDPPTLVSDSSPPHTVVSLTFSGSDVVAGLRQLAELGVIDPARMPSWMTGEEGVSTALIRGGTRVSR